MGPMDPKLPSVLTPPNVSPRPNATVGFKIIPVPVKFDPVAAMEARKGFGPPPVIIGRRPTPTVDVRPKGDIAGEA